MQYHRINTINTNGTLRMARCFDMHIQKWSKGINFSFVLFVVFDSLMPGDTHYSDVIMGAMRLKSPASRLFTRPFIPAQINKTSKLRAAGLCGGNSPVTGEFPTQMTSNAELVSIWWRHQHIKMGLHHAWGLTLWCIHILEAHHILIIIHLTI